MVKYLSEFETQMATINRLGVRGWLSADYIKLAGDIAVVALTFEDARTIEKFASLDCPEARAFDKLQVGLQDAVFGICVEGQALEEFEKAIGWPPRSAKVLLRAGLEAYEELI